MYALTGNVQIDAFGLPKRCAVTKVVQIHELFFTPKVISSLQ